VRKRSWTAILGLAAWSIGVPVHAASIAAGSGYTLVVTPGGTVVATGANSSGQLGDGTQTERVVLTAVSTVTGITSVSAGSGHSLALKNDGTVWAWGSNWAGQLGDGTTDSALTPVQVSGLTGVVEIAAGESYSLALKSDGTVWAWGSNGTGQLGDNSTTQRTSPVQVTGLSNVTSIAAGMQHGLARTVSGVVYSWGLNDQGQLGLNDFTQRLTPVQISSFSGVASVYAGERFSVALKSDGTLYSWGQNGFGQLGDGTTIRKLTPVQISTLTNVTLVGVGARHVIAITSGGSAYGWGSNSDGEIGDGTTIGTGRSTPTAISGLSSIASLKAGDRFSTAITSTGVLYAWGRNFEGQLGDGTHQRLLTPTAITGTSLALKTATPDLGLQPGTHLANQTLLITSVTPDATVRYTLTGVDPTVSDATVPPGGVVLDQSGTVKAKAWSPTLGESNVATGVYVLSAQPPTFSPAAAAYEIEQVVAINSPTPGATIRYTTNGTDPTASSTLYVNPIAVIVSTQIRARAFKAGIEDSEVAQGYFTLQVPAPTYSPGRGKYTSAQNVSVSVPPNSEVRYTTNGSDPTISSPLFVSPMTISTATTLKVKAFRTGWSPSMTRTATYEFGTDTTGPQVITKLTPEANPAGWNRTPVTVTFVCSDDFAEPVDCPAPVQLNTAGANQVVNRTVEDGNGNTTPVTVTVNIDLTMPALTVSSPADNSTTTLTTIAVTGTTSDALSGIASVKCNGVEADVSGGAVSCDADLGAGRNPIMVVAEDVAGNRRNASIMVTRYAGPATVAITPDTVTLVPDMTRKISVADDYGQEPPSVTWESSDTDVVQVTGSGASATLTAVAIGTATITATSGLLTATAEISVITGLAFSSSVVWAVPALPGYVVSDVIESEIGPEGYTFYSVENSTSGGNAVIRALDEDGVQRWQLTVPGSQNGAYAGADTSGGILIGTENAVMRIGGSGENWRIEGGLGPSVQSPDGTIFYIDGFNSAVVTMDGKTGQVKSRTTLPTTSYRHRNMECSIGWDSVSEGVPAEIGVLQVDGNNNAYLQLRTQHIDYDTLPCDEGTWIVSESKLEMLKITNGGAASWETLSTGLWFEAAYPGNVSLVDDDAILTVQLPPNYWNEWPTETNVRVKSGAGTASYTLPFLAGDFLAGEDNKVYTTRQTPANTAEVVVFNRSNGSVIRTQPLTGNSLYGVAKNDVIVVDTGTGLVGLDASGQQVSSQSTSPDKKVATRKRGYSWTWGDAARKINEPDAIEWADVVYPFAPGANVKRLLWPITVDNQSSSEVLVLLEQCKEGFTIVQPGKVLRQDIDGVKPPAWLTTGSPTFAGDWYKLLGGGVRINGDGTPTKTGFNADLVWNVLESSDPSNIAYPYVSGRKEEPGWSNAHPDWRYSPYWNTNPDRATRCATENYTYPP
jgi:alpha-tubulin suppressor-like RCC1 family protein